MKAVWSIWANKGQYELKGSTKADINSYTCTNQCMRHEHDQVIYVNINGYEIIVRW